MAASFTMRGFDGDKLVFACFSLTQF